MLFVSFHTGGKYTDKAKELADSLNFFGLPYVIEYMTPINDGDWQANCKRKCSFILAALMKHRNPVVWLDADCIMRQYPVMLFDRHDFAVFNWNAQPNPLGFDVDPGTLRCASGVLKVGYTAPAIHLLMQWSQTMRDNANMLDDPSLDHAYNVEKPRVDPLWLPASYNRMVAFRQIPAVIEHNNADGAHADGASTDNGTAAA
jgi:hypothetical protein